MTEKAAPVFPVKVLFLTSTLEVASTAPPVPAGTRATVPLGSPKLGVLLLANVLSWTSEFFPPTLGRLGRSKTRNPTVLSWELLPGPTSALDEFSISIPATLLVRVLFFTTIVSDWPT